MKSYSQWREETTPVGSTPAVGTEQPSPDDYNYYHAKLSGQVRQYLNWLVQTLETTHGRLSLVRKGFVMQEVMDALGLSPQQVFRLSNNIKKGFQAWHQAQQQQTVSNEPNVPGTTTATSPSTPGLPIRPLARS